MNGESEPWNSQRFQFRGKKEDTKAVPMASRYVEPPPSINP